MRKKDVERWAAENTDCDRIRKSYSRNGYEVWKEIYDKSVCVGIPTYIFIKDGEIRESTFKESLGYLDFPDGSIRQLKPLRNKKTDKDISINKGGD